MCGGGLDGRRRRTPEILVTERACIREAKFLDVKTIDPIEWSAMKGVSKFKDHELVRTRPT